MADNDLQPIVDDLAERLARSVAIDDPAIRLLAASRHFGDEDAVRVNSVLNRAISAEVSDPIFAQGVATWTAPGLVNVSGIPGALPRLCTPVRCNGLLLGYLWLVDEEGEFQARDFSGALEAAERAGIVLYRRLLVHRRSQARQEAILRELVSPDLLVRAQAIEDLNAEQLLGEDAMQFTVLAVHCRSEDAEPSAQGVALEAAVEDGISSLPDDVVLMAANRLRAWILLAQRRHPSRLQITTVTERIATRFKMLTHSDSTPVFGIGTTVDRLDAVSDSYHHAFLAARAAILVPRLGDVARWGELGPYGILLKLSASDLADVSPAPALDALEKQDNHHILIDTLETFFDHAGNVGRTAEYLKIHRATLYQRLKRIEQISGRNLEDGDDRLALHIGLKLRALVAAARANLEGTE